MDWHLLITLRLFMKIGISAPPFIMVAVSTVAYATIISQIFPSVNKTPALNKSRGFKD